MNEIEKSRAVQEVQAALVIAKRFPRDTNAAFTKMVESCRRITLAEKAMYTYGRGGTPVSGPSIRLAEVLAQSWGNIDCGVRELERRKNEDGSTVSIAESYCHDLENNFRQTKIFEVPHLRETKAKGVTRLTDSRDIYEIVANNGARRLRACILGVIPIDFIEKAVQECRSTIAKGAGNEPLIDRVRKAIVAFRDLGVSQQMIEQWAGCEVALITAPQFVDLTGIYTAIRDNVVNKEEFFPSASQADYGAQSPQGAVLKKASEVAKAPAGEPASREPNPSVSTSPTAYSPKKTSESSAPTSKPESAIGSNRSSVAEPQKSPTNSLSAEQATSDLRIKPEPKPESTSSPNEEAHWKTQLRAEEPEEEPLPKEFAGKTKIQIKGLIYPLLTEKKLTAQDLVEHCTATYKRQVNGLSLRQLVEVVEYLRSMP